MTTSHTESSFQTFVVDAGNQLAHAAALAVAETPGRAYSPLVITGPAGVGKTHLIEAIADYVRRRHPGYDISRLDRFRSARPPYRVVIERPLGGDLLVIADPGGPDTDKTPYLGRPLSRRHAQIVITCRTEEGARMALRHSGFLERTLFAAVWSSPRTREPRGA